MSRHRGSAQWYRCYIDVEAASIPFDLRNIMALDANAAAGAATVGCLLYATSRLLPVACYLPVAACCLLLLLMLLLPLVLVLLLLLLLVLLLLLLLSLFSSSICRV